MGVTEDTKHLIASNLTVAYYSKTVDSLITVNSVYDTYERFVEMINQAEEEEAAKRPSFPPAVGPPTKPRF